MEGTEEMVTKTSSAGQSAGGKHGSNAKAASGSQTAASDTAAETGNTPSGLNENTGEFRVGENIIFGMANGNIKIRRSPQGDEVEVAETTLAGLMIDAFFTDKFDGEYDVVTTR
jgi:outer membrane protein W